MLKILEQVPSAAAVVVVVFMFMNYMSRREKEQQDHLERREKLQEQFFRELHLEHLDARHLMREALERNVATMIQEMQTTQRNTETLERLARTIESWHRKPA